MTAKVTLTLDSASADGALFTRGSVRIIPSARIPDTADQLLLEVAPVRAGFSGGAAPSVQLYPCDLIGPQQSGGTPGWAYTVYYDGCPGNPASWSFYLLSTDGASQRLSSLASSPVAQPGTLAVTSVNGKTGTVALTAADVGAAPLDSPALTGTPTAPTPAPGDNSGKIATTEFVAGAVGGGGLTLPLSVADGGTGNAAQQPGSVRTYPVIHAPVKWGLINNDVLGGSFRPLVNYTYNNGASGVGATITSNANGALTIDGGTPALDDRVIVVNPYTDGTGNPPHPDGIYTVTDLGSGTTPWVLTRAADHDTAATLGVYWAVHVTAGATWAGATVQVAVIDKDSGVYTPFVVGTTGFGLSVSQYSSVCIGQQASAQGFNSSAIGTQAVASAQNATALGNTAVAGANTATAVGAYSVANGNYSTTLGFGSYTNGTQATAVGTQTNAYAPGMSAIAGGQVNNPADAQSTATVFCGETTDATPTLLRLPFGQAWIFEDWNGFGHPDWDKTLLVKATVVARRTDTPGTDSVWEAKGVLRGNGSNAYSWIGGSAPAMTLVAQDAAAAAWTAAVGVDNTKPGITVTAAGAAGQTVQWTAEIQTVEVSSGTA